MKASEAIEILRDYVEVAKERGLHSLPIQNFQELIEELADINASTPEEVSRGEQVLEWYRARLANSHARWSARRESNHLMTSLTATAGLNALKAATLINGGAAVAIIALLGSLYEAKTRTPIPSQLVWALACFGGGVFLSAIAAGATYVSQAYLGREFGSTQPGKRWRKCAIGATSLALFCFPAGAWLFATVFLMR